MYRRRLIARNKGTILLVILAIVSVPFSTLINRTKANPTAVPSQSIQEASPTATADSQAIALESKEYYFLQAGIFNDEGKAAAAADHIASLGYAGYTRQEDQKRRVLGAVYANRAEAESQKAQMGSDTYVKAMVLPGIKAHIQAAPAKTNAIIAMYNDIVGSFDRLLALQNDLDSHAKDGAQAIEEIKSINSQLENNRKALEEQFTSKDVPIVSLLLSKSEAIIGALRQMETIQADRTMEITSALKYNNIELYMQIQEINLQME